MFIVITKIEKIKEAVLSLRICGMSKMMVSYLNSAIEKGEG